jgi:hypothetical protein
MIYRTPAFWAPFAFGFSLLFVAMYLRHAHHSQAGAFTLITLGAFLFVLAIACFRSAQQYGLLMEQRSASSRRWFPERFYSAGFFARQTRIFGVLGGVLAAELILLGVMLLIHH